MHNAARLIEEIACIGMAILRRRMNVEFCVLSSQEALAVAKVDLQSVFYEGGKTYTGSPNTRDSKGQSDNTHYCSK